MALINTTTTGVLGSTFFGDGTGSLTIQQNGATLGTYGKIPTFYAYRTGGNQSITTGVFTKAQLDTELFDTESCFDNVTNYRFTPNVAGYYYITGKVNLYAAGNTITAAQVAIYKNGSNYSTGNFISTPGTEAGCLVSDLVYLNGSTDYVELYGYVSATSPTFLNGQLNTRLSGFLFKAA